MDILAFDEGRFQSSFNDKTDISEGQEISGRYFCEVKPGVDTPSVLGTSVLEGLPLLPQHPWLYQLVIVVKTSTTMVYHMVFNYFRFEYQLTETRKQLIKKEARHWLRRR